MLKDDNSIISEIWYFVNKLEEIIASSENQEKKHMFSDIGDWGRDMWRGIPAKSAVNGIPFTVAPDNSLWAKILNVDLKEFYSNPYTHLLTQLKIKKYTFDHFKDDTYLTKDVFIWFSIISSINLFGSTVTFFSDREPLLSGKRILEKPEDLDQITYPDFYNSGLMPRMHLYYRKLNELLKGRLKVMFPQWARGPFAIAVHLRGFENLLMDTIDRPEFVHKLMRFITDSRMKWFTERSKFLNEAIPKGKLYNDEVDSPTISPSIYREFVLPYEQELSKFHNGISYFHSCGNTTPFMEDIAKIPGLEYVHISPWSDLKKAIEIYPSSVSLDIVQNPLSDCYLCSEKEMRNKLESIVRACPDKRKVTVRIDGFQPVNGLEKDISQICIWSQQARDVLSKRIT